MKKKYTAVGVSGIVIHHTHAFDSMDALKAHLNTKPKGIMWHIMETVETFYEGPSSLWDLETSQRLQSPALREKWGELPMHMLIKRIELCHHMAFMN